MSIVPTCRRANLDDCCVIIPALNPSNVLVDLVAQLLARGFKNVVVINDGSNDSYVDKFDQVKALGAEVVTHAYNLGKGQAIKSGLRETLAKKCRIAMTMDSDGQHLVSDALVIAIKALSREKPAVVLGVRQFAGAVPFRSRFGNRLTQWIFKQLFGVAVGDTQTGLRAFPAELIPGLIDLAGDRYEYEMNVLVRIADLKCPIVESPIETIYIDGNSSSHFRPFIDSIRIYFVLFRDIFLSLSSFAIDIGLFTLGMAVLGNVTTATFFARAISGTYNFVGNKFFVFKRNAFKSIRRELVGYVLLAISIASISSALVSQLLIAYPSNVTLLKICVDLGLYAASFAIRRIFVFK